MEVSLTDCSELDSVCKAQVLDLLDLPVAHTMLLQGMLIRGQDLPFLVAVSTNANRCSCLQLSIAVPQQHGYRCAFSWRTFGGDN